MSERETGGRTRAESGLSVLLAEDHAIVRDGLACLLGSQQDIRVVGAVGDGAAAVREAERLAPHIVIMDISMPVLNGIDATRTIVARMPGVGVIVLSMHGSALMVRRALEAGASGYVVKDSAYDDLVKAVRAVASGRRYLSEAVAGLLPDESRADRPRGEGTEELTVAEIEILRLVADGKSNAEVGALLDLSPRTVETYRLRLMRKLGLEDLPSLVKYAIRHGISALD